MHEGWIGCMRDGLDAFSGALIALKDQELL